MIRGGAFHRFVFCQKRFSQKKKEGLSSIQAQSSFLTVVQSSNWLMVILVIDEM